VRELWSAVLLREPGADELARALALVERLEELQRDPEPSPADPEPVAQGARREMPALAVGAIELRAWVGLARALLSSNEFIYID